MTRPLRTQSALHGGFAIYERDSVLQGLPATDRAARRAKLNRSALVREALREHLRRLEVCALEERDRQGYLKQALANGESRLWEAEAAWLGPAPHTGAI
jgi:hypothetical protein